VSQNLSHSLLACHKTGTSAQSPSFDRRAASVKKKDNTMSDIQNTSADKPAPTSEAELARHASKMAKKKAARDRMMAAKEGEKGLIIVHTGAGKGKSSSGFGMILRSIAHGMPCAVVQFIKGGWDTGERRLIEGQFTEIPYWGSARITTVVN
jgi:hypothetical protein